MVAVKVRTSAGTNAPSPMRAGRLSAPVRPTPAEGGRMAALADSAIATRISKDPEAFVRSARQQSGE